MSHATEGLEIPLQDVCCPYVYPQIPRHPGSQQAPPTASVLHILLQRGCHTMRGQRVPV